MDKNQKSYIKVICDEEADPRYNKLQLRTEPPTYIELQPGENILTVEEYPALKYGFSQIDDTPEKNCQEVIEIDFSHFDGSELVSMERMLYLMPFQKIIFGEMKTPKLKNAKMAFSHVGEGRIEGYEIAELDISGLDFSSLENAECMFQCANIKALKMCNANLKNLHNGRRMIRHAAVNSLVLDGLRINQPDNLDLEILRPATISLKKCEPTVIKEIIKTIETYRKTLGNGSSADYILDGSLSYRLTTTQNGHLQCDIIRTIYSLPINGVIPSKGKFPPSNVEFESAPSFSGETILTLQEFCQKVISMPLNSQVAIVIRNRENGGCRVYNTEVVKMLDYDWDKNILEFWSVFISKGSLIEFSQITEAFFETDKDEYIMTRKYHGQTLLVKEDTPIYLNSTYGRKPIVDVIKFTGYVNDSDRPQPYIGLVIEE